MLKAIGVGVMNILRVIAVLWLLLHFTLTLIYVLPTTPVQSMLERLLLATIGRYFEQGWDFFAPDPIDTDYILLVRPLTNQEAKLALKKKLSNAGWYDLSSPVWTALQGNRFGAYVRFADGITNATASYDDDSDAESLRILVRYASAFCKDIGKGNDNYMALMIRERHSVPWHGSKAAKPPVITTWFIGIYRIDKSVEHIHLY
jgi:hypothetical protein